MEEYDKGFKEGFEAGYEKCKTELQGALTLKVNKFISNLIYDVIEEVLDNGDK